MTEIQADYKTGVDRQPWHCSGCGECIGYIYRHPRRVVVDTEDIFFVIRGDAEMLHVPCGATTRWIWHREVHGILDELGTTQEVIEIE